MKALFLILLFLKLFVCAFTQNSTRLSSKPPIDTVALRTWPSLQTTIAITNDSHYFMYNIENQPAGSFTFIVRETQGPWKKEFIFKQYPIGFFSEDNKQAIISQGDTLYFLTLGADHLTYVPNVNSYKRPEINNGEWLAWQKKETDKGLVLRNLLTGYENRFDSVADYLFSDSGTVLLLKTNSGQEDLPAQSLQWVDLPDGKIHTIWSAENLMRKGAIVNSNKFDQSGIQLVFMVQEPFDKSRSKNLQPSNSIWYYKAGMERAVMKVNDDFQSIDSGLSINHSTPTFNKNGNYIFFKLHPRIDNRKPNLGAAKVNVWSYNDEILQSAQLQRQKMKTFSAVLNIGSNHVIRLEQENEYANLYHITGDFVKVHHENQLYADDPWRTTHVQESYYLVSLKDGSKKFVKKSKYSDGLTSPNGNYIVYFDTSKQHYFSYEINSSKTNNISKSIPTALGVENQYLKGTLLHRPIMPVGIIGWLSDSDSLLIYDNYDIWLLDVVGNSPSINITNGYGRLHGIKFRLVCDNQILHKDQTLLLTAFNTINKNNGFYQKKLFKKGDPDLLIMGPYVFDIKGSQVPSLNKGIMTPLKAGKADAWIVQRQSATEAPNFYLTKDFRHYQPLTNFQPQASYNWITTELHSWKQLDKTTTQGVLYKPENFDKNKKYPIIFYFYEQLSQNLHQFPDVGYITADLNIPWFVSRGFLVFTPDIHFTVGRPGKSILNTVLSAAKYITQKSWVDNNRMGIQGHSFGGYATNYLITHSNLFAAAVSGNSVVDLISNYGGLRSSGIANSAYYESYQGGMGATLWQRPDQYIENSPVFRLDQVTTPILIMANKEDASVPVTQGIAYFTGLRRLGKTAWMLQYDGEGHELYDKNNQLDYTIRMTQFFDHYLKGSPAPRWMTTGVPARLKGIETGYEQDLDGSCGSNCPVCKSMTKGKKNETKWNK